MRMSESEYEALMRHRNVIASYQAPEKPDKPKTTGGGPNKTELEYRNRLTSEFPNARIVFEGISLKMSNGHRYTPDWFIITETEMICVEVKGRGNNGFRHPSYQRARLAFDQCKIEYPLLKFRWAEKSKGVWS